MKYLEQSSSDRENRMVVAKEGREGMMVSSCSMDTGFSSEK